MTNRATAAIGSARMKRPTVRDVARLAAVSVGTVSNVITGRARVDAATRSAVERAIADLGFTPNSFARSLAAQQRGPVFEARRNAPRLTVVGYISADYTARIGALPHRDDRITAQGIEKSLGGPATNVAVTASGLHGRLLTDAELVTEVGDDVDSDWALAELSARGVSTAGVIRRPGRRLSRCIVMVEASGSRTIINEPFPVEAAGVEHYLARTSGRRRHCLHLEGYQIDALGPVAARHRERGGLATLHATGLSAPRRTEDGLRALVEGFNVLFLHREVVRDIIGVRAPDTGPADPDLIEPLAARIARYGATRGRIVVLTLGALGAAVIADCGSTLVPALPVEPLDTTGVGDTFAGIFLAAWLNGIAPVEAAGLAAAGASLCVTALGAQGLHLTTERLDETASAGSANIASPD